MNSNPFPLQLRLLAKSAGDALERKPVDIRQFREDRIHQNVQTLVERGLITGVATDGHPMDGGRDANMHGAERGPLSSRRPQMLIGEDLLSIPEHKTPRFAGLTAEAGRPFVIIRHTEPDGKVHHLPFYQMGKTDPSIPEEKRVPEGAWYYTPGIAAGHDPSGSYIGNGSKMWGGWIGQRDDMKKMSEQVPVLRAYKSMLDTYLGDVRGMLSVPDMYKGVEGKEMPLVGAYHNHYNDMNERRPSEHYIFHQINAASSAAPEIMAFPNGMRGMINETYKQMMIAREIRQRAQVDPTEIITPFNNDYRKIGGSHAEWSRLYTQGGIDAERLWKAQRDHLSTLTPPDSTIFGLSPIKSSTNPSPSSATVVPFRIPSRQYNNVAAIRQYTDDPYDRLIKLIIEQERWQNEENET